MSDTGSQQRAIDEALRHHGAGDLAQAEALYRRVLDEAPRHPVALHLLGVIALQTNDAATAVERIGASLALDPRNPEAHSNLGNALQSLQRFDQAIASYTQALTLNPQMPLVRANLGNARLQTGQLEAAVADYRGALAMTPDLPEAQRNLATALLGLGRHAEALGAIQRARALDPRSPEVVLTLGNVLQALGRTDDALACFRPLVEARPEWAAAHSSLGNALRSSGQHRAAISHYDRALALTPDDPRAQFNRGLAHQDAGELDAAIARLRSALALDPDYAEAHRVLAGLVRHAGRDADMAAMQAVLDAPTSSADSRMRVAFGLGKAYEDLADYEQAFRYFTQANKLHRRAIDYSFASDARLFANLTATFTPEFFAAKAGVGVSDDAPVLIVGMPRSGTSLVEQILSSHASVHGGGELATLATCIAARLPRIGDVDYTEALPTVGQGTLYETGADYCARMRALAPGAQRVTDKLPMNFLHLGLLGVIAPGVRVIHCRRDPVATCLSIYKNYLPHRGHGYGCDLRDLGHFYVLYAGLMDHWRRVLPGGVFDVSYEALIADQEGQSRALVAAAGLPWDPACLDFHTNRRAVGTISAAQVRRPIYTDSVAHWRHFDRQLQPLIEILSEAGCVAPD